MEIDEENTVIIVRRGILMHRYSLNLLSRLERMGYFTLNDRTAIEICEDKYLTILKLSEAGLPIPKTVIVPNEQTVESSLEKIGGKFPIVVKTLSGTKGIGVFIISDQRSLKPILQTV
jgi:gamma-F420-2:alpha-L-glutamate ligase